MTPGYEVVAEFCIVLWQYALGKPDSLGPLANLARRSSLERSTSWLAPASL
jgi:hypothetical protein